MLVVKQLFTFFEACCSITTATAVAAAATTTTTHGHVYFLVWFQARN